MPTVRDFSRDMLVQYLKNKSLKYLTDSDGDFVITFAKDDDAGCELTVWLIAAGVSNEILSVRILGDLEIAKKDFPRAIMACNTWNDTRRWPKVALHVKEGESTGKIVCEEQIDLEDGIHQETLDRFINTAISTSFSFWKWVHGEQGF